MALDNYENVFIADRQNNRIRKVNGSTGIISTIAGRTQTCCNYNGEGIAADTADLNGPWGVDVDAAGNIYIADSDNKRIRKVNTSGIINTIAGNGIDASTGDGGPAASAEVNRSFGVYVDDCGAVYITNYGGNYSVRKISSYNISITSADAKCFGICNGTVNATASGGAGSYIFNWNNGLGVGASHSNACAGTYRVLVTDANNCREEMSVTLSQPTASLSVSVVGVSDVICLTGGSASATVTGGTAPYLYSWSSGSTSVSASGLAKGNYTVTVSDTNNCVATHTVSIDSSSLTVSDTIIFTANATPCKSDGRVFAMPYGGTAPYSFAWSNGVTDLNDTTLLAGNYSVTVTDINGCVGTKTFTVVNDSFPSVPVCMVTVDSISQHNIIIWDKTSVADVDSFIVYREIATNNYQRVNAQSYSDLSQFIDTVRTLYFPNTGNPNAGTYRYKIQTLDTCGIYSKLSPYHNTIYILNNAGTFYWTQPYTIQGGANPVSSYVLMRDNLSNGSWIQVSSVAGTQQTVSDPLYSIYQSTASWRVQTIWSITCVPTMRTNSGTQSNFSSSYSNVFTNNPVAIINNSLNAKLNVYPNPSNGKITLEYSSLEKSQKASIEVYNMIGKKVYSQNELHVSQTTLDLSSLSSGVYFLNFKTENNTVVKKIVIQ